MAATRLRRRFLGQTGTEYMLVISVITIAVVGAAYAFVSPFQEGVNDLGNDVKEILGGESIGGVGRDGGGGGDGVNGASPTGGPEEGGPGTRGMGAPGGSQPGRYERIYGNSTDVAWDPKAGNDPMNDILGRSMNRSLNGGLPGGTGLAVAETPATDSALAQAPLPAAGDRVAVLRDEEDA